MEKLSIEKLSEKLNGNLWVKGDIKRIYLDRGYNTKKMSTKTYVYQREDGTFGVSCYIECPSQNYNWIKSQQNEVIESVEEQIEEILRIESLTLVQSKVVSEKEVEIMVYVSENNQEPIWYTEDTFYNEFSRYIEEVFDIPAFKEILKQREEENKKLQAKKLIDKKDEDEDVVWVREENESVNVTYGIGIKTKHFKFGIGTVVSEDTDTVTVLYSDDTSKRFLKRFIKLEVVD